MMPVLIYVLFFVLTPWLYVWPAVLAAAIAGPHSRRSFLKFSSRTDDTPASPA